MQKVTDSFIISIIGESGARALKKASERSAALCSIIPPRVIVGWLKFLNHLTGGYEGSIPGVGNSYLNLKKTETGYYGDIALDGGVLNFQNQSLEQVAAMVASVIGVSETIFPADLKNVELANLGKSIDLLIKSKVVTDQLRADTLLKAGGEAGGDGGGHAGGTAPSAALSSTGKRMNSLPATPKTNGPAKPTLKAPPKLTLSEKEANKVCDVCGSSQMKNGKVKGCFCFRDLIKKTEVQPDGTGFVLHLGGCWDYESVLTFQETVGKNV
jgi:hypothetical protein